MKAIGIFMSFVFIMVIGFFLVGFTDSVQAPVSGEALNQYNNLTQAVTISSSGLYATMIILVAAMVFAAVLFMMTSLKKRRA